jgi:hypothetical protein
LRRCVRAHHCVPDPRRRILEQQRASPIVSAAQVPGSDSVALVVAAHKCARQSYPSCGGRQAQSSVSCVRPQLITVLPARNAVMRSMQQETGTSGAIAARMMWPARTRHAACAATRTHNTPHKCSRSRPQLTHCATSARTLLCNYRVSTWPLKNSDSTRGANAGVQATPACARASDVWRHPLCAHCAACTDPPLAHPHTHAHPHTTSRCVHGPSLEVALISSNAARVARACFL